MSEATMGDIERVSVKDMTPMRFMQDYAAAKRPVILLDVVPSWPCWSLWRDEATGRPKLSEMAEDFAHCDGPVTNCATGGEDTWNVGAFLAALEQGEGSECLYLKDWHFALAYEAMQKEVPYEAPDFLAAPLHDWLNLWKLSTGKADYRFCYIGARGTRTNLHHDVLFSHSWSANICGRKHWIFYPPEVKEKLEIRPGFMPSTAVPEKYDAATFPEAAQAYDKRLEVIQEPGELIFVPSGWYHEVQNLSLAISINHNWLNASNAADVWQFVQAEFRAAEVKIEDELDNFEHEEAFLEHCHMIVKASCDINVADWLDLLTEAWKALKSSFDEHPTGEKLREVEWVEARLSAVTRETLQSHLVPQTMASAHAGIKLQNYMQNPYQDIVRNYTQELQRVRKKYQAALHEHRNIMASLHRKDLELMQRLRAYKERRQKMQDRCLRGIADCAM